MEREDISAHTPSWRPYLIFLVCLTAYVYPFSRFYFGSDQGTLVYGAVRVVEGQVPLRDFFEVMGPGSFYWLALFFKLFGTSFFTIRISILLTSLSIALLIYFLTRRLKTGYDAVPAILFLAASFGPSWPANSHHHDSTLFGLLAFIAILCWIDKQRTWILCAAGALAGITTVFLQPKGLLLFLSFALLIWLFRQQAKLLSCLGWYAGGYLAIGLIVIVLYWRGGGLHDLVYSNVIWPLTNYSGINAVPYAYGIQTFYFESWIAGLSKILSPAIAISFSAFLTVPFLFIAALPGLGVLFAIFRSRHPSYLPSLPYWTVGGALWLSELHHKDITHLVHGSPLLIIACLYCLTRERHAVAIYALQLTCISAFALAALNGLVVLSAQAKITTRRGDFYAFHQIPILDFMDAHIKPGEEIFAYPYCPELYFLSATRNPTRFSILLYGYNPESDFHDAVRAIEEEKVHYVVWHRDFTQNIKLGFPAYSPPPNERLIIEPYLHEKYRLLKSIEGFDILERKERTEENIRAASNAVLRATPTSTR